MHSRSHFASDAFHISPGFRKHATIRGYAEDRSMVSTIHWYVDGSLDIWVYSGGVGKEMADEEDLKYVPKA